MKKLLSPTSIIVMLIFVIIFLIVIIFSKNQTAINVKQNPQPTEEASETASKDGTQDWQTYRNEKYGFKLLYPNTHYLVKNSELMKKDHQKDYAEIKDINIEKEISEWYKKNPGKPGPISSNNVIISVEDNSEELSLTDWTKRNINLVDIKDSRIKSVIIGNKKLILTSENSMVGNSIAILAINNNIIKLKFIGNDPGEMMEDHLFMKILKSIEVLK